MKTFEQKFIYLSKLMDAFIKLKKVYTAVDVKQYKGIIEIKFHDITNNYDTFYKREFPIEDIEKMILSYKGKFLTLWQKNWLKYGQHYNKNKLV